MTRDDLRPHGHTKPGDGGNIEGIDVDSDGSCYVSGTDDDGNSTLDSGAGGGLTEVASDSLTVAANGFEDATVSGASRDSNLVLTAYPDGSWGGDRFIVNEGTVAGQAVAFLEWDVSATAWKVSVDEDSGNEITVTWTVYEL